MSQLSSNLREAASRNHELLSALAKTDYAPTSLKQNTAYILDLQSQIKATDLELQKLHKTTEDERKDHLKYRDSTVKRFAHKLGGTKGKEKFTSRQEKEEREFLEAWQKEREATERREELQRALDNANNEKKTMEVDKANHDQAQKDLDEMYHYLFSGPTPEVPGEDQLEDAVQQARLWFDQSQQQLGREKHAMEALDAVNKRLQLAMRSMQEALSYSTYDMFGGGTFSDIMERDALSKAQMWLGESNRHLDEARRTQPQIKSLSGVNIDHGHIMSDVFFDNIFTDMAQHDRIKNSAAQLGRSVQELQVQLQEQNGRLKGAESQIKQASQQLESARKELQDIRGEAFERLAGSADAPPLYSA